MYFAHDSLVKVPFLIVRASDPPNFVTTVRSTLLSPPALSSPNPSSPFKVKEIYDSNTIGWPAASRVKFPLTIPLHRRVSSLEPETTSPRSLAAMARLREEEEEETSADENESGNKSPPSDDVTAGKDGKKDVVTASKASTSAAPPPDILFPGGPTPQETVRISRCSLPFCEFLSFSVIRR